jgi:hypothetical protein
MVFFAIPLASPSVVFPVMPVCRQAGFLYQRTCGSLAFAFICILFSAVKSKSQRAAPTLITKSHARKKQPKAILT